MGKNNEDIKKLSFLKVIGIEILILVPILFIFLRGKLESNLFYAYILIMLASFSILYYFINGRSFKDIEYKEYEKVLMPYFTILGLGVNILGILIVGLYIAFNN